MSAKNFFFEKLDLLNRLSGTYLESKPSLFEIERQSLLQACRAVYNGILSLPESNEPELESSEPTEKSTAEIDALKAEINQLKEELQKASAQESLEIQKVPTPAHPAWEGSPEARFNEVESKLGDEIVDQYNSARDKTSSSNSETDKLFEEVVQEEVQLDESETEITSDNIVLGETSIEPEVSQQAEQEETERVNEEETAQDVEQEKVHSDFSIKKLVASGRDGSVMASLQDRPIENLKKAIGLNDKFLYIRELFDNDHQEFAQVIDQINSMDSISDAENYLVKEVLNNKKWDFEDGNVISFFTVVYRRFIN